MPSGPKTRCPWQNLSLIAGAVQRYALKIQLLEQELIQEMSQCLSIGFQANSETDLAQKGGRGCSAEIQG